MEPDIGRLYEQHGQAVYRYIRGRGFDESAAADLTQETFLAAWRERDRFAGASRPLTWLIGIARHKLADETRRRERVRAAPAELPEQAGDFTRAADERMTIEAALDTLESEQRELIVLVLVTGLTYAEAARVTGVAEGTVKSRMNRIRGILRERMKGGDTR
jgi:RNA polymerase sigma-70 factor (ECF subfamily)